MNTLKRRSISYLIIITLAFISILKGSLQNASWTEIILTSALILILGVEVVSNFLELKKLKNNN